MKITIESAIYLVLFALICFTSVEFILLNKTINNANEVQAAINNYLEVNGNTAKLAESETESGVKPATTPILDDSSYAKIVEIGKKNNMIVTCEWEDATSDYNYWKISISYKTGIGILGIHKDGITKGYARTEK